MDEPVDDQRAVPGAFDQLALDLQQLRAEAGNPSYAELVLRIGRQREARGVSPDAARPGRTTVYDAFRTGRRRVDTGLVLEIVTALGVDEQECARWAEACRDARRRASGQAPAVQVADRSADEPADRPAEGGHPRAPRPAGIVAGLLVACIALNLVGRVVVDLLGLPIYLDMVGTAIAAVVLGPWSGALVGLVTNVAGAGLSGPESIPFALVNVVGALIWGYGVRSRRWGSTIPRYFALNVLVAVACTLIAVPIIALTMGGVTGNGADAVVSTVQVASQSLLFAVFSVNLLTSVVDKLISGFVALAAAEALAPRVGMPRSPLWGTAMTAVAHRSPDAGAAPRLRRAPAA